MLLNAVTTGLLHVHVGSCSCANECDASLIGTSVEHGTPCAPACETLCHFGPFHGGRCVARDFPRHYCRQTQCFVTTLRRLLLRFFHNGREGERCTVSILVAASTVSLGSMPLHVSLYGAAR
jgi:hypothetical protein